MAGTTSGSARHWSTYDIGDQTGRVALITGANSGIGLEAARELALKGATIILACRSLQRAEAAVSDIASSFAVAGSIDQAEVRDRLVIELVDVGVLGSVRDLADRVSASHSRLDLLINNAGIMAVPRSLTVDGIESQLATNHLGHFLLTARLFPLLQAADAARVVSIASLAHRRGRFDFEDMTLSSSHQYTPMGAYQRSKLANLLFTYELQRRLSATNAGVLAVAAHPGLTDTSLATGGDRPVWFRLLRPVVGQLLQGPITGALPTLRAATDPTVVGGQYYGPGKFQETSGPPVIVASNARSHDPSLATRLWAWSEQAVGLSFL